MKKNGALKILTILIILAICLISFVGIFVKDKNQMVNLIPDYIISMNLKGSRIASLQIDTSTEEITYDSEGNATTDGENEDGTLKEGYMKKDEPINPSSVLTEENYEISKKIIEKRLKTYGVKDYIVKQNKETGEIIVEIPENTDTDVVIYNLEYLGDFTIKDSETKEVLLDSNDVKEAKAVYGTSDYGTTVYLSIQFNKEGTKKFKEVTEKYVITIDEESKSVTKKITISMDDVQIIETYFDETINNGLLQLSVGETSTNGEDIAGYIEQATQIATLIDSGKMPIKYTATSNNYLSSAINQDMIQIAFYIVVGIIAIALIYLCVKYKAKGILLGVSYIGYIALLLIVLRYTNVVISFEAIVTMSVLLIANYMFIKYLLSKLETKEVYLKEAIKQTYLRYISILFPLLLIAIVFTFINWTAIASIGMIMFWGLVIMFIYNYITIKALLND